MAEKTLLPAAAGQNPPKWSYKRPLLVFFTNPPSVTVTDPFGNDTVYSYRASAPGGTAGTGEGQEDGYGPEWNDGLNYRIDYFEGDSTTGRLVRSELQEHDADRDMYHPSKHIKSNSRVKLTTTQYVDDGGRTSVASHENWDNSGHWKTRTESGFEVGASRTTRTEYANGRCSTSDQACSTFAPACPSSETCNAGQVVYRTDLLLLEEGSDGSSVLTRTDNTYDTLGRLKHSIARAAPLGGLGTGPNPLANPGDTTTVYTHSDYSGNVLTKTLSTGLATDHGYAMKYTYAPAWPACPSLHIDECGGYLATKQFLTPDGSSPAFSWKAIDRGRDANTGLIMWTRDPATYKVSYEYDKLGRVTAVKPTGEDATQVDYPSLLETTVTQGNSNGTDFVFTRYRYDGLGRLVATQKRPADSTKYACQKTTYDAANRVTFQSEWRFVGSASTPPDTTCIADQIEGSKGDDYGERNDNH